MEEDSGNRADEPSDVIKEFLKKKPSQGEELLSLILEVGRINRSSSARMLNVSEEVVDSWCKVLVDEGWFKKPDIDISDPVFELSDSALKRLRQLEMQFMEKIEEFEDVESVTKKHVKVSVTKKHFKSLVGLSLVDVLIFSSIVFSLFMLGKFLRDRTNTDYLLFAGFSMLFSLIIYKNNVQYSVSRMLVLSLFNTSRKLFIALLKNIRHITAIVLTLGVMYLIGRFVVIKNPYYLVGAVLFFSMLPVVYQKKGNKIIMLKLYLGLVLIIYALLLFGGLTSISKKLFNEETRVLDISVSILLLIYLKSKEHYFGLNVSSVKRFLGGEE
jgi:hypothetical protein